MSIHGESSIVTDSSTDRNADIPADERFDAFAGDGCHAHGHGLRGGEPVGVVITGGEVAHIVDVAEQEGHGAELP